MGEADKKTVDEFIIRSRRSLSDEEENRAGMALLSLLYQQMMMEDTADTFSVMVTLLVRLDKGSDS